ncbi:MAG: hypothetical protein KGP34_02955 [Bacteroidetes bacterium]|nr:hypothetical protein [Bacteroidota bacterium]
MQTTRSNRTCRLAMSFMVGLLFIGGPFAHAQMIRLQLTIPSGTDVGLVPIDPRVINPPRNNSDDKSNNKTSTPPNLTTLGTAGTAEADSILRAYTRWVELRSRENNELLIQVRFENDSIVYPVFVLNNGTSDFNAALRKTAPTNFRHYNKYVTMRDMPAKTYHFTAWLGLPLIVKSLLTIEYT